MSELYPEIFFEPDKGKTTGKKEAEQETLDESDNWTEEQWAKHYKKISEQTPVGDIDPQKYDEFKEEVQEKIVKPQKKSGNN